MEKTGKINAKHRIEVMHGLAPVKLQGGEFANE
jgi:hypothetical protein